VEIRGRHGRVKKSRCMEITEFYGTYHVEESHGDSGDIYEEEIQRDLEEAQQDAKIWGKYR
jgi:uracil-DNA glycosylase